MHTSKCDGQVESFRARAPRIQKQDLPFAIFVSAVRVPRDYRAKICRFRIASQIVQVMNYINRGMTNLNDFIRGKIVGPSAAVDVTADYDEGSDGFESSDNARVADVACMDDQVGTLQRLYGFRAKQAVGIGNNSNNSPNLLHGGKIASKPANLCDSNYICGQRQGGELTLTFIAAANSIFCSHGDAVRS
jgi:hypothetical protein